MYCRKAVVSSGFIDACIDLFLVVLLSGDGRQRTIAIIKTQALGNTVQCLVFLLVSHKLSLCRLFSVVDLITLSEVMARLLRVWRLLLHAKIQI